jgi:hypothetical protein
MINPRHIDRIISLVVTLALLASALLWWQTWNAGNKLRAETIAQAELRASQLNSAVADQVGLLIRYVDFAAQELAEAYLQGKEKGFLAQARKVGNRFPSESLLQIAVIGADGYIRASTLEVKERVYLGDREHFRVHRNSTEQSMFISAPVFGRVSRQWTIQFTRPVVEKDRFVGVLVISIAPAYLQRTLAAVPLSELDTIAIFRQSGEYLARSSRNEDVLGKNVGPNRPFVGSEAAASGTFRAAANFDGVVRLFHWQRLKDVPLVVVLGFAEDHLLKPVEESILRQRWQAGVATVVLWLLALGLVVMLRGLRR